MTNIEKVLLAASKSKRGITVGMAGMIKTVSPLNAYQTVMRIKALGFVARSEFYNRRFVITEAGKEKLCKCGMRNKESQKNRLVTFHKNIV